GIILYNVRGTVNRSTISANTNEGVSADYASVINVENTTVANNAVGVFTSAGSTVRLGADNIHENTNAFFTSGGGKVISFGNKHVMGNILN
ncbi:hypothetical protein, partial [Erwinia amylovora]|uniref:hypothetical protein n=1 Tax=Erwinia amylovora TaxID=552 RepID=UPI0020BF6FDE